MVRWPWKREPEEFYEPVKPRQKKTMRSVAEKILIKEMERNQDQELAQKVLGLNKSSNSSFSEMLKEHQAANEALGIGQGGGLLGGLVDKEVIQGVLSLLTAGREAQGGHVERIFVFPDSQGEVRQVTEAAFYRMLEDAKQQKKREEREQREQTQQPIQPAPSTQPETAQLIRPEQPEPPYSVQQLHTELVNCLNMEPADVIASLQSREDDFAKEALNILRTKSYEEIVDFIEPVIDKPVIGSVIQKVLAERADWLKTLLELAKETAENDQ